MSLDLEQEVTNQHYLQEKPRKHSSFQIKVSWPYHFLIVEFWTSYLTLSLFPNFKMMIIIESDSSGVKRMKKAKAG